MLAEEDDLVIGIGSKTASRTFSSFKTKHVTKNKLKGFHSFRHMYITAMERAGIEENVTAQIVGHERGKTMYITAMERAGIEENITAQIVGHERGKTMSYGYYSKGHDLIQLKQAIDKAINIMDSVTFA